MPSRSMPPGYRSFANHSFDAHDYRQPGDAATLWAKRVLMCTVPATPSPFVAGYQPKDRDTVVETGRLSESCPIFLRVRFARADVIIDAVPGPTFGQIIGGTGAPVLPFSPVIPITPVGVAGTYVNLAVNLRRGVDNLGAVTTDEHIIPVSPPNALVDRVPFDVVECMSLGVDLQLSTSPAGIPNQSTLLWVETIATPVDYSSPRDVLHGYNHMLPRGVPANPAVQILCYPRAGREQLIICNTSTNANLWVMLGDFAAVGAATFVLPMNTFATYESPVGCFTGLVTGIWDNPAPDGSAMISEGIYF